MIVSFMCGERSPLGEALVAGVAFVSFAEMRGCDVGVQTALARELFAAGSTRKLLRTVSRIQMLLQSAVGFRGNPTNFYFK